MLAWVRAHFMKSKVPVLEYSVAGTTPGKRVNWAFRFKTPDGHIMIESTNHFSSRAEAERSFVSLVKSIASNEYRVEYPNHSRIRPKSSPLLRGRCEAKRRGPSSARPDNLSVSGFMGQTRRWQAGRLPR